MTTKYKTISCPREDKQVRLSGEEYNQRGGKGNPIIYHQEPTFVCDESALKKCKDKNCMYAKKD